MTIAAAVEAASLRPARLASQITFLVAGFGLACWAPLIPFAKERLALPSGSFGLVLLGLGAGSICAMAVSGFLVARYGSRPIMLTAAGGMAASLPALATAATPLSLAASLFLLGSMLGAIDVAMNVQGLEVERQCGRPMLAGFHGLFSVGTFSGSVATTALLALKLTPLCVTLLSALAMIGLMLVARPNFLPTQKSADTFFVVPRGFVLFLAALAALAYLIEGVMLDWSALLVTSLHITAQVAAGLAFSLFAVGMTAGRLSGDVVSRAVGDRRVLLIGGALNLIGFPVLLLVKIKIIALGACLLIGFGTSNAVPTLFRRASMQRDMPPAMALAAVTMAGYSSVLVGPVIVGFVAQSTSLVDAFWILAALALLLPASAFWMQAPAINGS